MGSSSSSFTSSSPSFSSSSSSYSDEEFASCRHSPYIGHSAEVVERRALTLLGRIPLRSNDILKVKELLNRTAASERSRLVETPLLRTLLSLIAHFSKLKGGEEESGDASRRDSGIHDSSIVFRRKESLASAVSSSRLEPRGIGYGVGSTKSKWDIERVMEERYQIERRLTILLLTLTTLFRSPNVPSVDSTSSGSSPSPRSPPPPLDQAIVEEMVGKSCLLDLLARHLNNDSVFDVSMHISLYQALFELLAVMVGRQELLVYILRQSGAMGRTLFAEQLPRFQLTLSAYPSTIQRHHSSADQNFTSFIERVNMLAEQLREKLRLIDVQTDGDEEEVVAGDSIVETADNMLLNNEMKQERLNLFYTELLESHQMRSHRLLNDAGRPVYGYTFKRELRSVDPHPESSSHRERTRRIAKELASMHNALPLNSSNSIFVVMDETRCDMLKVLVSGPDDTPYQNGLFEFDVWFPQSYPNSPPKCAFLTTGHGAIRFNPNLYSDGKICLSILGTWEGRPEEKWNPLCSLLQVLISIQGLIFVRQPYFNEPGYERLQGTVKGDEHSRKYNLHIENATLIYAILRQFEDPPQYFSDVIKRHFWAKREAVIEQAERWLRNAAKDIQRRSNDPQTSLDAESSIMEGALMGSCLYVGESKHVLRSLKSPLICTLQRREVRRLIEVFDRMTSPE